GDEKHGGTGGHSLAEWFQDHVREHLEVEHGEHLAAHVPKERPMIALLSEENVLQRLFEPGDDGLKQHEGDQQDCGLEYGDVEPRDGFQVRVELADDCEIDAHEEG